MNAIVAEVARRGRVSFAEFMELALYHPTAGYYTRRRSGAGPAGRGGDFLTAPTASPVFPRTLAGLLRQLAGALGAPVTLAELGAGDGAFAAGVLDHLGGDRSEVLRRIVLVETAEWARRRIAGRVEGAEAVRSLAEASWPDGPVVLFASELYDALPVHRVTVEALKGSYALAEYYVEADSRGRLRWVLGEPSSLEIMRYLGEHGLTLEVGQVAEIRPNVRSIHAQHLRWCGLSALALVVDYGHAGRKLYDPRARRRGSLVGYRAHTVSENVLATMMPLPE